jgi:two-component system, chemotaxis family, sensor kinase CheA
MTSVSTGAGQDNSFDLTQFYQIFFEEASENLANMESLLLALDLQAPSDEELNAIFRCAHSIKGGAATFGFEDLASLTHVMETLLDKLRRHELQLTSPMIDVLLESGDTLKAMLQNHQAGNHDGLRDDALVGRISALASGDGFMDVPSAQAPSSTTPQVMNTAVGHVAVPTEGFEVLIGPLEKASMADNIKDLFGEIPGLGTIEALDNGQKNADGKRRFKVVSTSTQADLIDLFTFHVPREAIEFIEPSVFAPAPAPVAQAPAAPAAANSVVDESFGFFDPLPETKALMGNAVAAANPIKPAAVQAPAAAAAPTPAVQKPAGQAAASPAKPAAGAATDSATLRVSVEKVDQLINLVGELVITQAMLAQTGRGLDPLVHQQLMTNLSDLERNTRQLQEAVMAIRMIPMSTVFNRFPRMLRDLAAKLGKQVELVTVGEATELDKGMIEKITDPLTHLVRNSLDHGVELPDVREAAGKPAAGKISLIAEHKGGSIVIQVRDDGKGLAREKILAKAIERGMDVSESMTDTEVWQLIFEPGFSTAEAVTDVSGRGVGMDVVKKNILSLGGSVELDSAEGYGTRVSVKLPLTMAIMDGMSVGVAQETYILPLGSVVESIQLDQQQIRHIAGANRLIEVRDEYLPVLPLDEIFEVPRLSQPTSAILIVIESEGTRVALMVDELVGQQQVVVKNLEANYRKVAGVSGATILGDGRVALILDVGFLVKRARH